MNLIRQLLRADRFGIKIMYCVSGESLGRERSIQAEFLRWGLVMIEKRKRIFVK